VIRPLLALEAATDTVGVWTTLAQHIDKGESVSLLVEYRDRTVAAYLAYQIEDDGTTHVLRVLTAKPCQRQGIARKLLLSVMAQAERVTLDVHITNHPALALYGALGFEMDALLSEGYVRCVWVKSVQ